MGWRWTWSARTFKNVHLSVHPPTGRVSIAAPSRMSLETLRIFAISKLSWIRQQHLLEPTHNARFIALMDHYLPKWPSCRQLLNRLPVRHESWGY